MPTSDAMKVIYIKHQMAHHAALYFNLFQLGLVLDAHLTFTYGISKINFMFPHTVFTKMSAMPDQRSTCPTSHMFALTVSGEPIVYCEQNLISFKSGKFCPRICPGQFITL